MIIAMTNPSPRMTGYCKSVAMEIGVNVFCNPQVTEKVFEQVVATLNDFAGAIPQSEKFSATMIRMGQKKVIDLHVIGLPRRQFVDMDGTLLMRESR